MANRHLLDAKTERESACDELPPQPLLKMADVPREDPHQGVASNDQVRAGRIADGHVEQEAVDAAERRGHRDSRPRIGARAAVAFDEVAVRNALEELREIIGIALAV